ncbi:MAG: hypothetical protein MK110_01950 [Fuerstiella sp.]|nr:hypothetical protein [Fuerstiella sp.]
MDSATVFRPLIRPPTALLDDGMSMSTGETFRLRADITTVGRAGADINSAARHADIQSALFVVS